MAIVVETGSIIANAVSYISAADATTYHTARGNALWAGTDAVKEAALLKAAAYLDGKYRNKWKGYKVQPLIQAMEWPRAGVEIMPALANQRYYYGGTLPYDQIPQRLKDAQCELALIALSADLAPILSGSIRREKVDVLETEYAPGTVKGQKQYPHIDQLISDFIKNTGSDLTRG